MFKDKLKDLRKNHNYTQEGLAKKLNISRQSISKWENGMSYPTKSMLNKICEEFNLNASELLNQEELMYISIDNISNIKAVKRRTIIIITSIILLLIGIVTLVILFSERIKKFDESNDLVEVSDPLLGYIILDEVAYENYNSNDETSVVNLINSNLYPYDYLNVKDNVWDHNKIFENFTNHSRSNQTTNSTIYIKVNSTVFINGIYYDLEKEEMYISYIGRFSSDGSVTVTYTLEDTKNDYVTKDTYYKITIKAIDQIEKVEIYEYDESGEFIISNPLEDLQSYSLNINTMYFVLRETYKDNKGELYINKILIDHNDFDKLYVFFYKTFSNNCISDGIGIQINTKVS